LKRNYANIEGGFPDCPEKYATKRLKAQPQRLKAGNKLFSGLVKCHGSGRGFELSGSRG